MSKIKNLFGNFWVANLFLLHRVAKLISSFSVKTMEKAEKNLIWSGLVLFMGNTDVNKKRSYECIKN